MSIYACADLHGQGQLWDQIKNFLKPEDILYFLGDAIDRGPDGYRIMKELLLDKRVIYIKGNHELMMEDALTELRDDGYENECNYVWAMNGNYPTFTAWEECGRHFGWIYALHKLSTEETYVNKNNITIHLCHAGYTIENKPKDAYDIMWDRRHFLKKSIPRDNEIVIHGHTPISYLISELKKYNLPFQEKDGYVLYGNNTKIDIDCGSAFTYKTILLNLDTFETHLFKGE